ncbi:MAG: histidine kinase, partial [Gammaproteobacteria bacterium]|nr:histidine kinase [Gammaproteobacteria bacterium]
RNIKDEKQIKLFRETQSRIQSIALVHDHLYRSLDKGWINCYDYISKLTQGITNTLSPGRTPVQVNVSTTCTVDINRAIICGLIINE